MVRVRVVSRIQTELLAAMACVLGFMGGLLCLRLPIGITAMGTPVMPVFGIVPAAIVLPFFDQRFRMQPWYMTAGAGGAVLAVGLEAGSGLGGVVTGAVLYVAWLWLVGVGVCVPGLLLSRACYRLVMQDGTLCPGCGYMLVGLADRVCPECGRAFTYEELGTTRDRLIAAAGERGPSERAD